MIVQLVACQERSAHVRVSQCANMPCIHSIVLQDVLYVYLK